MKGIGPVKERGCAARPIDARLDEQNSWLDANAHRDRRDGNHCDYTLRDWKVRANWTGDPKELNPPGGQEMRRQLEVRIYFILEESPFTPEPR